MDTNTETENKQNSHPHILKIPSETLGKKQEIVAQKVRHQIYLQSVTETSTQNMKCEYKNIQNQYGFSSANGGGDKS